MTSEKKALDDLTRDQRVSKVYVRDFGGSALFMRWKPSKGGVLYLHPFESTTTIQRMFRAVHNCGDLARFPNIERVLYGLMRKRIGRDVRNYYSFHSDFHSCAQSGDLSSECHKNRMKYLL